MHNLVLFLTMVCAFITVIITDIRFGFSFSDWVGCRDERNSAIYYCFSYFSSRLIISAIVFSSYWFTVNAVVSTNLIGQRDIMAGVLSIYMLVIASMRRYVFYKRLRTVTAAVALINKS